VTVEERKSRRPDTFWSHGHVNKTAPFKTRHSLSLSAYDSADESFWERVSTLRVIFARIFFARGKLTLLEPYFRLFQWRLSALGARGICLTAQHLILVLKVVKVIGSCLTAQHRILVLKVVRVSGPFPDILLELTWGGGLWETTE